MAGLSGEGQSTKKDHFGVLNPSMGGGPRGLGDPDDKNIRHVETLLIEKLMREKALELCDFEKKEFDKCLESSGTSFFYKCRPQMKKMRICQGEWFYNEDFKKQMTDEYLDLRTEYRKTGVSNQRKDFEKSRQEEFEIWLAKRRGQQAQST